VTCVKFKDNFVIAPSYGKIVKIHHNIQTNTIHLCIFLSPFDVHQQYYPINGTVIDRKYDKTGHFNLAFDLDKSRWNEKKIHVLQNKYGTFIVTQIAGRLVHCIVSEEDTNTRINAGTRFGMIKLGSRVDIEIPNATNFKLLVNKNDTLVGGYQVIGYYSF
jgi:phosphatidylserine decarboxylase